MSAWTMVVDNGPRVRLETSHPMTLQVTAPVSRGRLAVAVDRVDFHIELSLSALKAGNFLMQGAARALVKRYDGDLLVFTASGTASEPPWSVSGEAAAGAVLIPMGVVVTPSSPAMTGIHLGGSVTMQDISIPIPGLSGISEITFTIDGQIGLRETS